MEFDLAEDYEGAKALIRISGTDNIVLMRRGNDAPKAAGLVDLPGGRAENGESPFITCTREVAEELDIKLIKDELVGASFNITPSGRKAWLLIFGINDKKAKAATALSETREVIIEPLGIYLKRDDAWKVFQEQVKGSV